MEQIPHPGEHVLAFCGDTIEFTLRVPRAGPGRAFLRTNIGHADTARLAIIAETTLRQKRLAEDWFDLPMTAADPGFARGPAFSETSPRASSARFADSSRRAEASRETWRITLPLTEVGHFEAKAFFLPEGINIPVWPDGKNSAINVHPAEYCCLNTLYNAFVRLFGKERHLAPSTKEREQYNKSQLEELGFAVIPPSGTFRDLVRQLDFIVGELKCRIIMLLPIHPTPTVYGRMGVFGSPYAALDFMDVDPALAEFDRKATPLEQFGELVDAVHARGAKLFLDIAINHTGWAAKIHSLHPEWLARDPDGAIRSPGAWGVTWADLTELDYKRPELWNYLAEVFLAWCRRGADGFRCDAGYMIPVPAWEFIVASVRREFPDTIFLLEGLGGSMEATTSLLNYSNLNMAYSELFQNYDRGRIENYLQFADRISGNEGLLMHFAETHDNNRLAAKSPAYARMRTALSALCSSNGAFAFANGVEWLATEKIDVHKRTSLNWNNPVNQVEHIARLNSILNSHPAFFNGARLEILPHGSSGSNTIAVLRHHPPTGKKLLVLINLNEQSAQTAVWPAGATGFPTARLTDLLTGKEISIPDNKHNYELAPGEALCLTPDADDLRLVLEAKKQLPAVCIQLKRQELRARALEALVAVSGGLMDISAVNPDQLAEELATDPREFCRKLTSSAADDKIVIWNWPNDVRREVMIPPSSFILVQASAPFRAELREGRNVLNRQDAIRRKDGGYFALFMPRPAPANFLACTLHLSVYQAKGGLYAPEETQHSIGHILFLPEPGKARVKRLFKRNESLDANRIFLGTNGRGGMLRAAIKWGELRSKYDALLAGNLNPRHPEDRRIMLTRCRIWLVYQSYSQDITLDRLEQFAIGGDHAHWQFRVPFGYGKMVYIEIEAAMLPGLNAIRLGFKRLHALPHKHCLSDAENVRIIIFPDLEDRNFHEETKAYLGPEKSFPQAIKPQADGFVFAPDQNRQLKMTVLAPRSAIALRDGESAELALGEASLKAGPSAKPGSKGSFHPEPKWHYMVPHPLEAERGLPASSDLFSPGYFQGELKGGDEVALAAAIITPEERETENVFLLRSTPIANLHAEENVLGVLENSLRQFIVRREDKKTVIAGYPWFLDWGRDTLIFCRGMIAAGLTDDVLSIIRQFVSFEQDGALPNMIIGNNASNRDSSDAPLWLFTACADLKQAIGGAFLNEKCGLPGDPHGERTLLEVLRAIAVAYRKGTANGIACDSESGLIFSPAHFTWMDTNHPAGTPREGYPIEIQALWFAALKFLTEITNEKQWDELAELVRDSIIKLYWNAKLKFFSDCLHASKGTPAARAKADDALRPNQLLALTLGAVGNEKIFADTLSACAELLVPGAIRTLANRPVEYPLPVEHNSRLINDPKNPYWGRYEGDEDTRRKPAYHNGTAWTWIFPSFCEAWFKHYGNAGRQTALAILNSSLRIINSGCLGQIPEILDGDYPHSQRGCDAQAWGVSELYRVWKILAEEK